MRLPCYCLPLGRQVIPKFECGVPGGQSGSGSVGAFLGITLFGTGTSTLLRRPGSSGFQSGQRSDRSRLISAHSPILRIPAKPPLASPFSNTFRPGTGPRGWRGSGATPPEGAPPLAAGIPPPTTDVTPDGPLGGTPLATGAPPPLGASSPPLTLGAVVGAASLCLAASSARWASSRLSSSMSIGRTFGAWIFDICCFFSFDWPAICFGTTGLCNSNWRLCKFAFGVGAIGRKFGTVIWSSGSSSMIGSVCVNCFGAGVLSFLAFSIFIGFTIASGNGASRGGGFIAISGAGSSFCCGAGSVSTVFSGTGCAKSGFGCAIILLGSTGVSLGIGAGVFMISTLTIFLGGNSMGGIVSNAMKNPRCKIRALAHVHCLVCGCIFDSLTIKYGTPILSAVAFLLPKLFLWPFRIGAMSCQNWSSRFKNYSTFTCPARNCYEFKTCIYAIIAITISCLIIISNFGD